MIELDQFILQDSNKRPLLSHNLSMGKGVFEPSNWRSYKIIHELASKHNLRIGFVFTSDDPYFYIDLDNCRDKDSGVNTGFAEETLKYFNECYREISGSGTGYHLIGRCDKTKLPTHLKNKGTNPDREWYIHGRVGSITGDYLGGDIRSEITEKLTDWLLKNFDEKAPKVEEVVLDGPVPEWRGPIDDDRLIDLALRYKSIPQKLGAKASFEDLWNCNESALAEYFKSNDPFKSFGYSEADAALCTQLAFWTGKDRKRIESLFNRSKLVRDKWRDRTDYRKSTIDGAVAICSEVFGSKKAKDGGDPDIRRGYQYLSIEDQIDKFDGFVYVTDVHKIFLPNGRNLKPDQFRSRYGGFFYALDDLGEKTTPDAWKAFTETRAYDFPKVDSTLFQPQVKERFINREGEIYLNTFFGFKTPKKRGEVGLFLNHLARLFPDDIDRQIIISYFAAVLQHPGVKFQWCPVIQGTEGNGKTFFNYAMIHIVGRKMSHMPKPKTLLNKFNGWMQGKIYAGIEEIAVGGREEILNELKWVITNEEVEIERKGVDQILGTNFVNFCMNSNHRNAIGVPDSRRFCVFYTPQQNPLDLVSWGLDGDYFPKLYGWARREDGWAKIHDYLTRYKIEEEFNPASLSQRAPKSSSYKEVVEESRSSLMTVMEDLISSGVSGLRDGWISSLLLNVRLKERGVRAQGRELHKALNELGFIKHPSLMDGRLTCFSPIDGGRPRLYVKPHHPSVLEKDPIKIKDLYIDSQTKV